MNSVILRHKPRLIQKYERLPRSKRMTICIGMLGSDGVVIAADTQETDQYYKREQSKIMSFIGGIQLGSNPSPPTMALALTGAGRAGYIDAFYYEAISKNLFNAGTAREVEDHIAKQLQVFHERHIFPLATASDSPEIQILIGAYVQWQTFMLVSDGSTLRKGMPYCAVGAGAHFALSLITELWRNQDVAHLEILAAYIVGMTKESIESCGKYTQIVSLHGPIMKDIPGQSSQLFPPPQLLTNVSYRKIRKWEESFGAKWSIQQRELISRLIDEELADDSKQSISQMSAGQQ